MFGISVGDGKPTPYEVFPGGSGRWDHRFQYRLRWTMEPYSLSPDVSSPAKLLRGCPLSDRRGHPKVTPARISLIAWPFVSSWRNATSKDSLSVIFQIAPNMSETVSDRPNSFS